jgi:hypothetical protein
MQRIRCLAASGGDIRPNPPPCPPSMLIVRINFLRLYPWSAELKRRGAA